MWTYYFDKIFLISLDHLKTSNFRLPTVEQELNRYGIHFDDIFPAIAHDNGAYGCYLSYQKIFAACLEMKYKNVLIFEDDIKIIHHALDSVLTPALQSLPNDYHTIHLGPNTHIPLQHGKWPFLLTMHQCRSTHAQAYSLEAMKQIVSYEWNGTPIDQLIEERLQPQGKCFCTYPLLVTQRNGYSDIDKRDVNMYYIEERFEQHTKHLRQ